MFLNMKIKDMYQEVVGVVSRQTGVDEYDMLHSNKEECVDARSILVNVLISKGVTENEIVSLTRLTQQCVNKLKNNFPNRLHKWSITTNLQAVNSELTTI